MQHLKERLYSVYKFKQNGVKGNLLETLTNSLNDRKQRVVLNG